MKPFIVSLALTLAAVPASTAQDLPKPTPAVDEALHALVERCVVGGGLERVEGAKPGASTLAPGDPAKLKAVVEGARATLTPAVVDALIARCAEAAGDQSVALISLLRVEGEIALDERAVAFAAWFEAAKVGEADGRIALLEGAARRFRSLEERAWRAACYARIGNILGDRADFPAALEMDHKALEIFRAALGDRHPSVADIFNHIAILFNAQGEHAKALEEASKSLEIRRFALGERHQTVAASYNNIALIHEAQGEHAKALELNLKALEIRRVALGERHPDVADSYNNIANVYVSLGEHARALEMYLKALEIRRVALGERHPRVATCYNNIANVHATQGAYEKALEMHLKALEVRRASLGERHFLVAASYNNIAAVYDELGEHARALEMHLKALEIFRAALGDRHPSVGDNYGNIATTYNQQGEHAKALEMHLKALEIFRAALGDRHPRVADTFNQIPISHVALGEPAKALEAFGRALVVLGIGPGAGEPGDASRDAPSLTPSPLLPQVLLSRGRLHERRAGTETAAGLLDALADYRAAAEALDRLRDGVSRDEDKVRNAEDVSEIFPLAVGSSARLAAATGTTAPFLEALSFAERGAARVFLEGLGRSRASAGGRVDPATLAEEARLAAEIDVLDGRISVEQDRPSESRERQAVERVILDRKRAEEGWRALVARMEREAPQYAALKHPRPCTIAEARACLAVDEVALLYVLGSEASYLVVVSARDETGTGGLAIHELPSAETVAEAVAALTQPRVLRDADATLERGEVAYKMLLAPAAGAIAGKRLVIVPGGFLGRLPFELLAEPGGEGGPRFLVQGHSIRYAPSLTALHMIRRWEGERPEVGRALWALGDPVYAPTDARLIAASELPAEAIRLASQLRGVGRGGAFERLAGSGREVNRLSGLMGSGAEERLLGPDATEAAVKRLSADGTLAKYRYIHFACHGVLGTGEGIQPGLVLSQVGNPRGEDGYLRLDEVTDLRLNADLVALSACQTGQGQVFRAEGVSGLARAFLYAGSRGVLCSLWSVDDDATSELMADLYGGLKTGQSTADALRSAQLKMAEAGEPPLHWAPFVLIGR